MTHLGAFAAAVSHWLEKDGHIRSGCPARHRLSCPEKYPTGFIVWKSWDGRILVRHNINENDMLALCNSAVESAKTHLNAYAKTLSKTYAVSRDGFTVVVGEPLYNDADRRKQRTAAKKLLGTAAGQLQEAVKDFDGEQFSQELFDKVGIPKENRE